MSQGGQVEETCRICLESSPIFTTSYSKLSDSFFLEDDRLISPCACSGTQAFVHFKCLRRWQRSVMATRRPGAGHGPALVCSVCTQKFSVAPPRPPLGCQLWKAFAGYSCEVTGRGDDVTSASPNVPYEANSPETQNRKSYEDLLCRSQQSRLRFLERKCDRNMPPIFSRLSFSLVVDRHKCAFYVALAGHSLQSLLDELEGGLALAREVLPCSFRLNSVEDDCTAGNCNSSLLGSKGWASSSNSNRLHPVTLLIATSSMPSPYFFGSVVLLYEHQRCSGSRGLVLNKEAGEDIVREWEKNAILGQNRPAMKHIEHGIGGPHGQDQWTVLHRCQECAKWASQSGGQKKLVLSRDWGHELLPGLYLGREIGPVFRRLDACNLSENSGSVGDCPQDVEKGGNGASAAEDAVTKELGLGFEHHVLHGHAKWVVGQLGSEIRRGWWIVDENSSDVLISTPLNELWHALRTA